MEENNLNPLYERVIYLEQFPFPRPVVLFGVLNDLAKHHLVNNFHLNCEKLQKFIIPPICTKIKSEFQNQIFSTYNENFDINNQTCAGFVRLSAIKVN